MAAINTLWGRSYVPSAFSWIPSQRHVEGTNQEWSDHLRRRMLLPASPLWGKKWQASEGEHPVVLQITLLFSVKAVGQCGPKNDLIFLFL